MSMFQLGYLKPSDRVMINNTIVKSTGTFNLYAESKKMHWAHPELQSSDFVEYLIQRGLMVSTEGVDIVTRYCCEGHDEGEDAYLMMVGDRDALELLIQVIADLEDYTNPDLEGIVVYTLELSMMTHSDTLPTYLAYILRTPMGLPEYYKLKALKDLTTAFKKRLGVDQMWTRGYRK